ncbi:MAG: LptF/LptG family permease [Paludibaculum sp.]
MGILSRTIFREIASSAVLGALMFIFVLFLQKAGQLFTILVSSTTSPETVGYLFLLLLPATMPLTIPLGVLVGTLIGLSRMSSDGEITALRAAGVPARRVTLPVTAFALLAMSFTGYCSLQLTPWCQAEMIRVINQMGAAQLTAEIQPRVFDESFPNKILYVGDVLTGQPVRWRNLFMADLTPPAERKNNNGQERGEGPVLTIASEALVLPDTVGNRLQLSLRNGSTYEAAKDPQDYYKVGFPTGEQALEARERGEVKAKNYTATPTLELVGEIKKSLEARIEFHQRLALPLACVLLALTGIPLGVSSRKGGKSAAFVITVVFAFFYFTMLVSLIQPGAGREDGRRDRCVDAQCIVRRGGACTADAPGAARGQGHLRFDPRVRGRPATGFVVAAGRAGQRHLAVAPGSDHPAVPAASGDRHLRRQQLPFLFRDAAVLLRDAHGDLQFL